MNKPRFVENQNRKLGQLLMELNDDLRFREHPVIQIGALKMVGYAILCGVAFLIFTGLLRACVNAGH